MTQSIWDNPEMKVGGDFVKFENVGDSVSGKVISIGAHRWDDGSVSPQLLIQTSELDADGNAVEKTVTAGQIRLKAALAEKRPEAGDYITIKFTQIEKRQGGKTLKHFDVDVQKGAGGFSSAPFGGSSTVTGNAATDFSNVDPSVLAALQSQLGATPVK